ncbi:MAG: extracellular solute-binding protein [Nitrososphaerota archaeon]|nr:extracellular solute-binding protein [Nitrososphaerota archaeon]MDG6967229.1 extracellular solute-binding protein [Nitrososphaerota archaeon]MDG6978864.1 extracellular solute-binding protein [Nitrososphaerota archaeon]
MDRREFLRYGIGLAGAGIFSLGLVDLASPGLLGKRNVSSLASSSSSLSTASPSPSSSSTSTQLSSLPDYQDFLSWLQSVSGPYSGKSLDISLEQEFGPLATQLIDSDFQNASGIRDQYNIVPYQLQLDDISLMASTQSSSYDCYGLDVENLGVFPDLPISPYTLSQQYPEITYPGNDFSDFRRFSWDRIATYPPDLSGGAGGNSAATVGVLPFDTPTLILFYRKDVYSKLGLTPATTWDEHMANSQKIQNSGLTPFGSVSMAAPAISIVYEYQAHLASFGGSLFAVDGNDITPTINSNEAVQALENYVGYAPYSDPASATYTWENVFQSLAYGSAAHGLLFDGFATWIDDPLRSYEVGLFGYATNPAGPAGSFHPYAGSGVGVSRYSKNPQMAWLWVQWATAKGAQEAKLLGHYKNFPTRSSPLLIPEIASDLQTSAYAVPDMVNQIWNAGTLTTLLGFPAWLKCSVIIMSALAGAWKGGISPTDALNSAQSKVEAIGPLTFQ